MEKIHVLYWESLDNHTNISSDLFPHYFSLECQTGREIYLLDVLPYLKKMHLENSKVIAFLSMEKDHYIELDSIFSVVPVFIHQHESFIQLRLQFNKLNPSYIVPLTQAKVFMSASREKIYSSHHVHEIESKTNSTESMDSNLEQRRRVPQSSTTHPIKSRQSNLRPVSSEAFNEPSLLQSIVGDDTAAALTETASAAAKSFFQFATSSLKNVTEAASTIVSTGNSSQVIGRYKVTIFRELAEGAYGKVYWVTDTQDSNKHYAMKQLICQSREQEDDARNEIQILSKLVDHENIISFLDYSAIGTSKTSKTFYLLFPMCRQGTVWNVIENALKYEEDLTKPWPYEEAQVLFIIQSIANALGYMHEMGFSHRDVKPHNILISDDNIPKLTDFGSVATARWDVSSRQIALRIEDEASIKTSPAYRSPELTSVQYPCIIDERVDIWGLGCTMYCLAFGWSPFESKREGVMRLAIINGKYSYPNAERRMKNCVFSKGFCHLIDQMLQFNITDRPFGYDILESIESLY